MTSPPILARMAVENTSSQAPMKTGNPTQSAAIARKPHGRFLSLKASKGSIRCHNHPMADESELCKDILNQTNHAKQYNNLPRFKTRVLLAACRQQHGISLQYGLAFKRAPQAGPTRHPDHRYCHG